MKENVKSEDYMGMISWSKTNGSARNLFGTEIKTANPIVVRVCHAEESRDLSKNWYFPKSPIVELEMSPIQWAEFLTSGNTSGVPCTLKYINREKMSEPKGSETMEHYSNEVNEHFDAFREIQTKIKEAVETNKPMGKKSLESLLNDIDCAIANVNFIKDSFKGDMDKIMTKAKAEFNAYVENRIYEIGIETVKKDSVKFLEN